VTQIFFVTQMAFLTTVCDIQQVGVEPVYWNVRWPCRILPHGESRWRRGWKRLFRGLSRPHIPQITTT